MIRPLLAVISGMLCAAAGFRQAASLRREQSQLTRWAEVIRHLALILSEGSCSLPEALRRAAAEPLLPDSLLRALADGMLQHPLLSLPELWEAHALQGPEQPVLSRLMNRLCRGTLESRCQAAEQAAQELSLMASQARDKAECDAKLWRTLGLTGGACLTIMLL